MRSKTKVVRIDCTREQIFLEKCYILVQVPADATHEEIEQLDEYVLASSTYSPLGTPEPDDNRVDEAKLEIESITDFTGREPHCVVVRDKSGCLVFKEF